MKKYFCRLILLMIFAFVSCSEGTKDDPESENTKSDEATEVVTPTPDFLLDEILVEMEGFAKAMNSVSDVPSAESAVVEIKKHTDATLRIAKEMGNLSVPSEPEKKQLAGKWEKFEQKLRKEPRPDRSKMTDPQEVRRIMRAGMQSAGKTLEEADAILRKYGIQLTHSK